MQTCNNREKYTFCVKNSLEHLKNLKTGRIPIYKPRTEHARPQKSNPSRETVPLMDAWLDEIPPSPFPDYFLRLAGTNVRSAEGISHTTTYDWYCGIASDVCTTYTCTYYQVKGRALQGNANQFLIAGTYSIFFETPRFCGFFLS